MYESDELRFGGYSRLEDAHKRWFKAFKEDEEEIRPYSIDIYLPARTALVFCAYENAINIAAEIPEMPVVTDRQRSQLSLK